MKWIVLLPLALMLAACGFTNNNMGENREIIVSRPSVNAFEFVKSCHYVDVSMPKRKCIMY